MSTKKGPTALNILTAEKTDVELTSNAVILHYDDHAVTIPYTTLSVLDAMFIRVLFSQPRPMLLPGQDTAKIIKEAEEKEKNPQTDDSQQVS